MSDAVSGGADAAEALHRLLSEATPEQRASHLLRLIEEAADACLRLPELAGMRLPLHGLRLDAEALRPHAENAAAPPSWWHGDEGQVRLRGAGFRGTNLQEAVLTGVDLTGADFADAVLRSAVLDDAGLEQASFERTDGTAGSFQRARASQACFREALLEDARFGGAVLRFADFEGALLENADLAAADLWGAKLDGAEARGAVLRNAVLREASLAGTDLSGADLRGADLKNADLSGARLKGANLRGADLAHARLDGADLGETELVQVSLLACGLKRVRLAGAWMERTRLRIDQLGGALGEEAAADWGAARQGYLDLEQNFRGLGDVESASWCYRRARRMAKRDSRHAAAQGWRGRDWRAVLPNATAYASDGFVEWLCDYGESLPRVVRAYVLVAGLFAAYYGLSNSLLHAAATPSGTAWVPTHDVLDLIEYSVLDMTTSGTPDLGLKPASHLVAFVGSLEYMTGVLLVGLFGFVLGNRIRR